LDPLVQLVSRVVPLGKSSPVHSITLTTPSRLHYARPFFSTRFPTLKNEAGFIPFPTHQLHSISGPHLPFARPLMIIFPKVTALSKSKSKPNLAGLPAWPTPEQMQDQDKCPAFLLNQKVLCF
jgi:hypothetical protein